MDRGAHVINMSYANAAVDAPGISLLERPEIRLALQRGALLVAAMGSAGPLAREAFPAALVDGSPVAAVEAIAPLDQRLPESQRGSHLSVVASGARIVSALPSGHLGILSGTSMAAAYVSGAAALAQSFRRQRGKTFLAPLDLKNPILASARRLPSAASPRNNDFGHGCLDVNRLSAGWRAPRRSSFTPYR